ncbi:MAG: nucleotidyltransferase family protein [Terracidiphilus sp.]
MCGHDELAGTAAISTVSSAAASTRLGGDLAARAAVLKCFCNPRPAQCACLQVLSGQEWEGLSHWLDISGLALYLFDRLNQLEMSHWLPAEVFARLKRNLDDNMERTRGLIAESNAIQSEFQRCGVSYAVLKGFSLWPSSVAKLELRRQSDQDYLVAERDADEARRALEARGYHLRAISGRTWEFKTGDRPARSLADLYKANAPRSVELHLEMNGDGGRSLLVRRETRAFHGIAMPVLPAADVLLWQGMHLFKHLCYDHARASHLLEFRRHVMSRSDDAGFWRKLESTAGDSPRMYLALGVVTRLIERMMGRFAPQELRCWSVDRLPEGVRLWVDRHGHGSVLGNFPGNKFYLFLQEELEKAGVEAKRSLREQLLPLRLPPLITVAAEHESLPARMRRASAQLRFLFLRLRFHVVEGLRYAREARRWRQQTSERAG